MADALTLRFPRVSAAGDAERPIVPLLVIAGLTMATVGLARAALAQLLHVTAQDRATAVAPPRHPVLLCNPWSGGGKVAKFGLVEKVVDDGQGPRQASGPGGHGLLGMRERVGMYGGRLDVGPEPGRGFAVRAVLPVAT